MPELRRIFASPVWNYAGWEACCCRVSSVTYANAWQTRINKDLSIIYKPIIYEKEYSVGFRPLYFGSIYQL